MLYILYGLYSNVGVKESNCLCYKWCFASDKHLSTRVFASSTVSFANFRAVPDKVHRHTVLNHTMQEHESGTAIKFSGDTDDDANISTKTCLS